MKKGIGFILTAALSVMLLTACGGDTQPEQADAIGDGQEGGK